MKYLRAAWRLAAAAALAALYLPAQVLIAGPLFHDYDTLPSLGMKATLKLMGIEVVFNGAADAEKRHGFYIANHLSYLDPFVLGSVRKGALVQRDDVSHMPVIGFISRQSGVIPVKPGMRGQQLPEIHSKMAEAFNAGRNVIVFPEGDINDGKNILPFKTGILSILFNNLSSVPLLDKDMKIRPFTIRLTHVNGQDVNSHPELKNNYQSYGLHGKELGKHIINLLFIKSMRNKEHAY